MLLLPVCALPIRREQVLPRALSADVISGLHPWSASLRNEVRRHLRCPCQISQQYLRRRIRQGHSGWNQRHHQGTNLPRQCWAADLGSEKFQRKTELLHWCWADLCLEKRQMFRFGRQEDVLGAEHHALSLARISLASRVAQLGPIDVF